MNEQSETEFTTGVVVEIFGGERHRRWANPLRGSEDFADVLEKVPGAFVGLSAVPACVSLAAGRLSRRRCGVTRAG